MKRFRRINILVVCLTLLALLFSFNLNVNVNASNKKFSNEAASYDVKEVRDERDLGYGVYYHRDWAAVSTDKEGYSSGRAAGLGGGEQIVIGKEYTSQVNVLEVTPNPDAKLVPYAVLENGNWHTSSVRNAAEQYELTHPGKRVVAAVNGDFFHIGDDVKASTGATVGDGEFYKALSHHSQGQNIAIKNSGSGKQLFTMTGNQNAPFLTIYDEEGKEIKKVAIDKVNTQPADGEIALFYATRDKDYHAKMTDVTATNAWYVDSADQAVTAVKNSFYGKGKITGHHDTVTFGEGRFAVVCNNPEIDKLLKVGTTIRCQYEFTADAYKDVKSAIGFPFRVMDTGVACHNDDVRHPRTIIGQREDGTIIMAVIDGRQVEAGMFGATCMEMAALMGYYGCTDAWNLDGGGSSTLLVRKQAGWDYKNGYEDSKHEKSKWYVTNSPSDASERRDGNCLLIVVDVPEVEMKVTDLTANSVKINVALISTLEKYKDLYIKINDATYKVEKDGTVNGTELKQHENYTAFLWAKVDGEMVNLMSEIAFTTCYEYPTGIHAEVVIRNKKGVDYILLKYKVEHETEGVENIYFLVGDQRYGTSSGAIYLDQTMDIYDALNGLDLKVIFNGSSSKEHELLDFKDIKVIGDADFTLNEILFRNTDDMQNIFK